MFFKDRQNQERWAKNFIETINEKMERSQMQVSIYYYQF